MLTKETLELLAKVDSARAEYDRLMSELSKSFEEDTNGSVNLCVPYCYTQLHYNRKEPTNIQALLHDIADDGDVKQVWSDKEGNVCLELKIDKHTFAIVLRKEDLHD